MKKIIAILAVVAALFTLGSCGTSMHDAQTYTGTLTITGLPTLADINTTYAKNFTGLTINGSAGGWASLPNTNYDGSGSVTVTLDNYKYPWDLGQVPASCKTAEFPIKVVICDQDGGWFSDEVAGWYGLTAGSNMTATWASRAN